MPRACRRCSKPSAHFNSTHCSWQCRLQDRIEKIRAGLSDDDCWEWPKVLPGERTRYPTFLLDKRAETGKQTGAHRAVYILTHGAIPEGMYVCHDCDNVRCVNPIPLIIAPAQENSWDRVAKGRNYSVRKLTPAQAKTIFKSTEPSARLAVRYGVTRRTINAVKAGQSWVFHTLKKR